MSTSGRSPDTRVARVPANAAGQRLDRFLVEHFPPYSRRQIAEVIRSGAVRLDGTRARPGTVLAGGERLEIPVLSRAVADVKVRSRERERLRQESRITDEIQEIYRDDVLLVVSKPPDLPVHGGAGLGATETLIDRLREDVLSGFGLVHRLDRDTSGAIALVRGEALRAEVAQRFADPEGGVEKTYEAIVEGVPDPPGADIELPLLPPGHRGKARVDEVKGKPAHSRYTTLESFEGAARLQVELLTGRTHQIRAHLAAIGHPLLVDPQYGNRGGWRLPDPRGRLAARLRRTPLHASVLVLPHPGTGERLEIRAPLPGDMRYALEVLRVAAGRRRKGEGSPDGTEP